MYSSLKPQLVLLGYIAMIAVLAFLIGLVMTIMLMAYAVVVIYSSPMKLYLALRRQNIE